MKAKILVTGSGGFIGSNFIRTVINNYNYNICSIDKVNRSSTLNTIYINKNHDFHIGDICDEHFINIIFEYEKPDFVVNFAGTKNLDKDILTNNINGLHNLISAAKKFNVGKFIQISTQEVYGDLKKEGIYPKEDSKLNPETLYAVSKLASEDILKVSGLDYNICRLADTYGQRQGISEMIPHYTISILNDKDVTLDNNGKSIRDNLNIQDLCDGIVKILEKGGNKEIYNIAANQEFSKMEIFYEVSKLVKENNNLLKFNNMPEPFRYASDASKLMALGWKPKVKFRDGLSYAVKYYQDNKWLWKGKT